MSSLKKLPKPAFRPVVNSVYQASEEIRVARVGEPAILPRGTLLHVLWASKRWAEVETVWREPLTAESINLRFRIPVQALEDVT